MDVLLKHKFGDNAHYTGIVMEYAIRGNDMDLARLMLDRGAKTDNDFLLLYAAELGRDNFVTLMLDRGADVNAGNYAVLRVALENGHLNTTRLLIRRGANLNKVLSEHNCPVLTLASANGHFEAVRFILDHGAEVYANFGTALNNAKKYKHRAVVKLLRERHQELMAKH